MVTSRQSLKTAIEAVDRASSRDELLLSVQVLADFADLRAVPKLIEVLGFNNPLLAHVAIGGIIKIGPDAVPLVLEHLDQENYSARAWSVRALAQIRDSRALELLSYVVLNDIGPSVRYAAAKGLGVMVLSSLPAVAESQHQKCIHSLSLASSDSEWTVRYAACVGLERRLIQHVNQVQAFDALAKMSTLTDTPAILRDRARTALQRLNVS